jgi:hypothetical protein
VTLILDRTFAPFPGVKAHSEAIPALPLRFATGTLRSGGPLQARRRSRVLELGECFGLRLDAGASKSTALAMTLELDALMAPPT